MFRFTSAFFMSLAALATVLPSHAIFTSFHASKGHVKAGETILVSFGVSDYPQQNTQYYAAFGLNPTKGFPDLIGTPFGDGKNLLTDVVNSSSDAHHHTYNVTLPKTLSPATKGSDKAVLAVAVFQVIGASGQASIQTFNTTIKLAK